MENVLVQIRLALCEVERPARLVLSGARGSLPVSNDYGIHEAVDAYTRAARTHGWEVPSDMQDMISGFQ
jgi:ubiquitin-conjugating enzyme E2 Q